MDSTVDWNLDGSLNPGQTLPEITRLELNNLNSNMTGGGSASSVLSGGVKSPGRKTMKEYEQQQKSLEEENFNLKLRVYMLEERLYGQERPQGRPEASAEKSGEQLVELKVQLASLREELAQKKSLLRCASDTLDKLEKQNAADLQAERQRQEARLLELQKQLEEAQRSAAAAAVRAASSDSVLEPPYMHAFPASPGRGQQLEALETRTVELQSALNKMKQMVEERDREAASLQSQLEEARAAAARHTARADTADQAHQQLQQRCDQLQQQLTDSTAQWHQLKAQLQQTLDERDRQLASLRAELEETDRAEQLQRTCDQLTAGRAADGARIAELMAQLEMVQQKLHSADCNEKVLKTTLQIAVDEHKAQLAAARADKKRAQKQTATLLDEMRKQGHLPAKPGHQESALAAPPAEASDSSDTSAAQRQQQLAPTAAPVVGHAPTPHEIQVYLLRSETQRKDKKIRSLVAEMKEMNNMLMKYRWEVKEVAEEENERLWTELEENKKLIKELQDEKMELVLEKERQIQRLLSQLKERGEGSEAGCDAAPDQQSQSAPREGSVGGPEPHPSRQTPTRLRADSDRSSTSLQELHAQVQSLRSQLAHAWLQVRERDTEAGQLRQRLLQLRRQLDSCPDPQQMALPLDQLCQQLAAPRPGPPDADALGGAGEMAADRTDSTAGRSDNTLTETGSEKTAALRAQVSELRTQAAARESIIGQLEARAAASERLRGALQQCERQLAAAEARLAELAPLPARLAEADQQLTQLPDLREQLAAREQELTLAEGQLNEIAELRDQLAAREAQLAERQQQLTAASGLRTELQQTRELLVERDEEKAALLQHLDQLKRDHDKQAEELRQRLEATLTAPPVQQYQESEERHVEETAQLHRQLKETRGAAHLLQSRLQELAEFLELLLSLERSGVLDLSCVTEQRLQQLQLSLTQSRQLSESLSQSVLMLDADLNASFSGLNVADMSSLHVPPLPDHSSTAAAQSANSSISNEALLSQASALGTKLKHKKMRSKTTVSRSALANMNEGATLPPLAPKAETASKQASTSEASDVVAAQDEPSEPAQPAVSVCELAVQTSPKTAESGQQAADGEQQRLTEQLADVTAQLHTQEAQLTHQTALIATLRQQLAQAGHAASDQAAEAGGDSARLSGAREPLPGEVRDSFRWLVQRQRTADRGSGPDSVSDLTQRPAPVSVERALSPILSVARAQSAELLRMGRSLECTSTVKLSKSEETVHPAVSATTAAAGSDDSDTVQELKQTQSKPNRTRHRIVSSQGQKVAAAARDSELMPPPAPPTPPPAPGDFSESEAWSEPDRDVSLARIGLDQSSLGTRTESWLGTHSESDVRHSRRRGGRSGAQDVQDLEAQIESLQQVKRALRAEVDIYQKVIPADAATLATSGDTLHVASRATVHGSTSDGAGAAATPRRGVVVPMQVLEEIHSLQQQLERAIAANDRIRRQLELTPRRAAAAAAADDHERLALALRMTQEQLEEANERLEATQQRCDDLRAKLNRAKENLRLAQLNAEQFKDKFVRVSDDMVRLRERFTEIEADRAMSDDSWRRRHELQEGATIRLLERELKQARQTADELRLELQAHGDITEPETETIHAASDKENRDDEAETPRATRSETQLLELNREKLRLLSERSQLATRGRLLRSESCLLSGERRQLTAQRRLEAAKWAGWEAERQHLLDQNAELREERGRLRRQLVTGGAEAGRAARRRLQAEADQARQAQARLETEHAQCERRLAELGRVMTADKERLSDVSHQLEEVNAEMEAMRAKLNELDDAGHSCPESARSCELTAELATAPPARPEPGRRRSSSSQPRTNSESEMHDHDAHHESDRTSAYSSPDLGIESDCNRCTSRSPQLHVQKAAPPETAAAASPSEAEAERLRRERDQMESKLASTRAALQQALDKLTRADQRKARVERAIYRQLSKTHDILRRAKNNLAPPSPSSVEQAQ